VNICVSLSPSALCHSGCRQLENGSQHPPRCSSIYWCDAKTLNWEKFEKRFNRACTHKTLVEVNIAQPVVQGGLYVSARFLLSYESKYIGFIYHPINLID
jgi:hypothetical protein